MRTSKTPAELASELALPVLLVLMHAARLSFVKTGPSRSQARISPNASTLTSVRCGCLPTWFTTTLVMADIFYAKIVQPVLEFEGHNPDNPINRASLCFERGALWLERIRAMLEDLAMVCFGGNSCPPNVESDVDPIQGLQGLLVRYSAEGLSTTSLERWENMQGCTYPAVQQDATLQPAYEEAGLSGQPTVRFNGVDQHLTIPLPQLGHTTLVVVGDFQSGVVFSAEGRESPFPGKDLEVSGSALLVRQAGAALAGPDVDRPTVLVVRESLSSIDVWVGAQTQRVYTGTPESWDPSVSLGGESPPLLAQLGRRVGGPHLAGAVSEFLLFDRALEDEEITAVSEHLTAKWNLS